MFASITLLATPFLQMWNGDHMNGDWGWAGWLSMSLAMLFFWGTIVVLGVWALRTSSFQSHSSAGHGPIDIARERYARGEISDEEFERLKRGLK